MRQPINASVAQGSVLDKKVRVWFGALQLLPWVCWVRVA
jgi:hypothetical protein